MKVLLYHLMFGVEIVGCRRKHLCTTTHERGEYMEAFIYYVAICVCGHNGAYKEVLCIQFALAVDLWSL